MSRETLKRGLFAGSGGMPPYLGGHRRGIIRIHAGISVIIAFALTGCVSIIEPVSVDGSKADGTVTIGATHNSLEKVDWSGADAEATARCQLWGYSTAEGFEGVRERCVKASQIFHMYGSYYTCDRKEVTRVYQCIE